MAFLLPPRTKTESGELRRVGVEMEFGGVSLEETSQIILDIFGGRVLRESQHVLKVETKLGEFQIEADSTFLKERKYEPYLKTLGLDPQTSTIGHNVEDMINVLAGTLVPFEVVSPPLPIDRLECIEQVREALCRHSARGTKSAIFTAFGMQFNPEVPDLRSETLLNYLRAFFLLFDWLFVESEIPIARRIAPFIHDFPQEYIDFVLNPEYQPDRRNLMIDYMRFNPTRNRPLDLLPLFAHIDHDLTFSFPIERELVKARPTFHYRLPNSLVDDPRWKVADEWNKWIEIEKLAADPERVHAITQDYRRTRDESLVFTRGRWVEKTRGWLHV